MRGNPRRAKALTLFEVLITVSIIVVLISILMAALGSARRTAQRAVCLSNLRQLQNSAIAYATSNCGRTFATIYSATGYWIPQLAKFNTRLDNLVIDSQHNVASASTNQNLVCPAAATFAKDVGAAAQAWGPYAAGGTVYAANSAALCPNSSPASWAFLDSYAGSYGFNGWLYNVSYPTGGAMARSISGPNGAHSSLNFNAVAVKNITARTLNGNAVAGGSVNVSGGNGTRQSNVPGVALPPVYQIFLRLKSVAATITSVATIDFSQNSILYYNGNADLNDCVVIGSGVLCVNGNVSLPTKGQTISLVVNGGCTVNGNHGVTDFTGDIYMTGDLTTTGTPPGVSIRGTVVCLGDLYCNGNNDWTITGNGLPAWGSFGNVKCILTSPPVISFADAIWPEGSPSIGDTIPANTAKGDVSSQIGRFYIARHGYAINAAFSDGHAETVPLPSVTKIAWR